MAEAQGSQLRSHVEIKKNITILNGTGAQNPNQSEDRSTTTHTHYRQTVTLSRSVDTHTNTTLHPRDVLRKENNDQQHTENNTPKHYRQRWLPQTPR